jgi:hypothetical protein
METKKLSIERTAIVAGLFISIAMTLYFIIMAAAGFAHVAELRFLNFVIAGAGAAAAIKYFNNKTNRHIQYLEGLTLSFVAIAVSSVLFSLFIFFYFSQINPGLLNVIRTDAPMMGKYLTPFSASVAVIAEGVVAGLVLSFTLMQYFKDDTLHSPYKQRKPDIAPEKES